MYRAWLQKTLLDLLHLFIYDSTSRHYNLWLQWVMTLWCLVSERSLDLFSGLSSISVCPECWQLADLNIHWLFSSLSLICVCRPLNRVFASGIEDAFSHGCIFRCNNWLLKKLLTVKNCCAAYRVAVGTQQFGLCYVSYVAACLCIRCHGSMRSACRHCVAMDLSEAPPNPS
jgi:hypothetical protein